jgi:hypothetical protein
VDRGVHEEFTGALHTQAKRPDLGQSFDNVSKGYWLGKKLEKFVGDLAGSGFFKNPEVRGAGTAPAINPQAGRDFATSNQADFGRPQMPGTQGGMFQGQPTGSRDSVRDLAGGLFPSFTRFPGLGSGSVGVQIPRFRMQQRVGQQYPTGSKPPENAREIAAGILPLISPSVGVE